MHERYDHDDCRECGHVSLPAESVPDQSLRYCPKCGHEWQEDLRKPPYSYLDNLAQAIHH